MFILLHHVEVNVSNLAESEAFWGWLLRRLGYTPYQRWEQGFSFRHGHTYLVFVQTGERFLVPPYHRCRVGLNHLAFYARSKEQVDELTLELKERGCSLLYPDRHPYAGGPGHYAVFFEDPNRIKVEVVASSVTGEFESSKS